MSRNRISIGKLHTFDSSDRRATVRAKFSSTRNEVCLEEKRIRLPAGKCASERRFSINSHVSLYHSSSTTRNCR